MLDREEIDVCYMILSKIEIIKEEIFSFSVKPQISWHKIIYLYILWDTIKLDLPYNISISTQNSKSSKNVWKFQCRNYFFDQIKKK